MGLVLNHEFMRINTINRNWMRGSWKGRWEVFWHASNCCGSWWVKKDGWRHCDQRSWVAQAEDWQGISVQEPSACTPRPCITRSIDVILGVKFASRDRPKPNAGISKRMLGSFLACIELLWFLMSQEGWMATLWPTLMSCSSRRLARYFCTSTVSLYSTAMLARSYRLAWGNVSSQARPRHTHAPTLQIKPRRNFRVEVIRMRCSKALIHMHNRLWVGARCEGGNTRLEIPREGIGYAYVNAN